MTIWETLGVPPTANLAEIRRAYASRARQCHPEEDPEGFGALHRAYRAAVELTQTGEQMPACAPVPARETATMDVTALIARGLEAQRHRRAGEVLEQLEDLCSRWGEGTFYYQWKQCLASQTFRQVMLDRDFLAGLCALLAARRELPQGACLALYFAYGLGEGRQTPHLEELRGLLEERVPSRRRSEPPGAVLRPIWHLWDGGKGILWLAGAAALCLLPNQLGLEGAALAAAALLAQGLMAAFALGLRALRLRRRPGWTTLRPRWRALAEAVVPLYLAGGLLVWGLGPWGVLAALPAGAAHLMMGEYLQLGPEGVELYLPLLWGRLVCWEDIAGVRLGRARTRRGPTACPLLEIRLVDGGCIRVSGARLEQFDPLLEAARARGLEG